MTAQPQLFEPGEYLDKQGPGFFSVCAKPDGQWRQNSYELSLLPTVVEHADRDVDTYITQATFQTRKRSAVNVQSVGLLFVDLDTYHCKGLRNKTPEEQTLLLLGFCCDEGLPPPSLVLFSGRGLQAKWLLQNALTAAALPDWNRCQQILVKLLEPFAADRGAKDIARVLRLDHTVNTKSGEVCRIVYGIESVPARYDFDELYENLTDREPDTEPVNVPTARKSKPRVLSVGNRFSLTRLNWLRMSDIRDLWKLRGGVPVGFRETTLFWEINFLLLAHPVKTANIWKEAQVLAAEIDNHGGWYRESDLSTVYRKAKEMQTGEIVTYNGIEYPSLYTPRNQTLIELFGITSDEQQHLQTIISNDERVRRQREKRRSSGIQPRDEYEAQSIERNKPWIAEGISRRWWYERRRREAKKGETP
jgi:hypothetical protein